MLQQRTVKQLLTLYSTPNDRERGNDAAVLLARPGEEDGEVMLNPSVFDATALICDMTFI